MPENVVSNRRSCLGIIRFLTFLQHHNDPVTVSASFGDLQVRAANYEFGEVLMKKSWKNIKHRHKNKKSTATSLNL